MLHDSSYKVNLYNNRLDPRLALAIFAVHVLLPQASTEYRPIGSCREQSEPGHAMATSQHTQPHQLPIN